ncbi:Thioesterase [Agrobacterium tumefaciens]|nr:Thioesterase [Agrobacterium tumefaciens]
MAVLRTRRCFRVMLDGEDRLAGDAQPAIGAVEQRDMGLFDAFGQRLGVDRKAVVHRDDFNLAGREVFDRMVRAVMALMHLFGLGADRKAEHLVSEADAEDRQVGLDEVLDDGNGILARCGRVSGAVGQEHAIRLQRHDVFSRGLCRNDRDLAIETGKQAQDVALDAEIDADNMIFRIGFAERAIALVPDPRRFGPGGGLAGGGFDGEIKAHKAAPRLGFRFQRFDIEDTVRIMGDNGVRRTVFADPCRQGAGVDAAEADDAAGLQPGIQMLDGTEVRGVGDVSLEDDADSTTAGGGRQVFNVFLIGADISDMRKGEGDDLAEIGGVGQDFLVTCQRRVEADLGLNLAGCADARSFNHRAIGKNKHCSRFAGSPGRCLGHLVPFLPLRTPPLERQGVRGHFCRRLRDIKGRAIKLAFRPFVKISCRCRKITKAAQAVNRRAKIYADLSCRRFKGLCN